MLGFCLPKCEEEPSAICACLGSEMCGAQSMRPTMGSNRGAVCALDRRSGLVSGASGYGVVFDSDGERSDDGSGGADELDD